MRLPPYGKSVDSSNDPVWVVAGYFSQAIDHLKHRYPNQMGIFLWDDPQNYSWPVKGRDVVILCWLYFNDEYIERLIYALFLAGAAHIALVTPSGKTVNHRRSL